MPAAISAHLVPERNLRFTIAYDGARYCGWQRQTNGLAVQQVFEEAYAALTGEQIKLVVAGRTDAGVHAYGQVASGWVRAPIPVENLQFALQSRLPSDVVVREAADAAPTFHARFSAKSKRYRYVMHNSAVRWPFLANYAYWHRKPLDAELMQRGAEVLLGEHDFRSFGSDVTPAMPTRRTIHRVQFGRRSGALAFHDPAPIQPEELNATGEFLLFEIEGDGFLYNMVRAIVGTLIHVGRRRWNVDDVRQILAAANRSAAGETAPAHGLYLMQVDYPNPSLDAHHAPNLGE